MTNVGLEVKFQHTIEWRELEIFHYVKIVQNSTLEGSKSIWGAHKNHFPIRTVRLPILD
jgi:hypothetical protein